MENQRIVLDGFEWTVEHLEMLKKGGGWQRVVLLKLDDDDHGITVEVAFPVAAWERFKTSLLHDVLPPPVHDLRRY